VPDKDNMFFNLQSTFKLGSLCLALIVMMVSSTTSNINTVSYAEDNTTSKLTSFLPGRNVLASSDTNSTLDDISKVQDLQSKLLAKDLEDILQSAVSALELVTDNLTPMKVAPNETLLKTTLKTLHGIPPNADEPKRKPVEDILSKYKIFEYISYDTPRGNVYLAEPFPAQTSIPTPNFANREHFKGAIATKAPFLSNVIKSASYGTPHAALAIPVYSQNDNSGSLVGVLVGGLNFTYIDQSIRSLNLTDHNNNQRIILTDHNGTAVFDSSLRNNIAPKVGSFASLQSFKNALEGRSGSMVEPFNGTKMLISYHPVKAVQRTWVLILMKTI
jgi:Cache domain